MRVFNVECELQVGKGGKPQLLTATWGNGVASFSSSTGAGGNS